MLGVDPSKLPAGGSYLTSPSQPETVVELADEEEKDNDPDKIIVEETDEILSV